MDKAAGAAVLAAAPEAAAAGKVAGAVAGKVTGKGKGKPAGGRSLAGEKDPAKVNAELQRRRAEAAAGKRHASSPDDVDDSQAPADAAGRDAGRTASPASSASPQGGGWSPGAMQLPATGGGFVLGLMGWAVARAYLAGGPTGIRKLLAAKFLNKTS